MKTHKKSIMFIGVCIAVVVLCVGALMFWRRGSKPTAVSVQSGEVTIRMMEDGYEPSEITITKGTKVTFDNVDKYGHWPASDLHPTHTIYPEFDPKRVVKSGEKWSFEFDKKGEWGMHDHLSPYIVGKITVVE